MRNKKALRVMIASLALLSGDEKQVREIFRGFTGKPEQFDRRTERYRRELERITRQWIRENEDTDPSELAFAIAVLVSRLQNAAERNLKEGYRLGLGVAQLDEFDLENIQIALEQNRFFLENSLAPAILVRIEQGLDLAEGFAAAMADASAFSENRSGLYAGSFWTMIWVGLSAAIVKKFGNQALKEIPVRRLLDPTAKHCSTCPPKAGEYQSWEEMLAFTGGLPADGSDECVCITTGESRILTLRGQVPIAEIQIGDMVLTHLGRWRAVTDVIISKSNESHRQAWIESPLGTRIGCTADHKWLTPIGWCRTDKLARLELSMYNRDYAEALYFLREENKNRQQARSMQGVFGDMSLRQKEGLQSEGMLALRYVSQSKEAMASCQCSPENACRIAEGGTGSPQEIRGLDREIIPQQKIGREDLCVLLGERQEEIHLSLSMAMDQKPRGNPGGNGCASYQSRSVGRPPRELGIDEPIRSLQASLARGCGCETPGDGSNIKSSQGLCMPILSREVHQEASQEPAQQILLAEMLPLGTPLYDITVEEDHSFIIENLIAKNSNCRCTVQVQDGGTFVYAV